MAGFCKTSSIQITNYFHKLLVLQSHFSSINPCKLQITRQAIILSIASYILSEILRTSMSKFIDYANEKEPNLLSSSERPQQPIIQLNQHQKYAAIIYQKPIFCQFQRTVKLLPRLLHVLGTCPHFDGSATLESNISQSIISKSLRPTAPSVFVTNSNPTTEHKVNYSLIIDMEEQQQEDSLMLRFEFKNTCDAIHSIIERILESYNLENRVEYWTSKFQKELLRSYEQQQRSKPEQRDDNI